MGQDLKQDETLYGLVLIRLKVILFPLCFLSNYSERTHALTVIEKEARKGRLNVHIVRIDGQNGAPHQLSFLVTLLKQPHFQWLGWIIKKQQDSQHQQSSNHLAVSPNEARCHAIAGSPQVGELRRLGTVLLAHLAEHGGALPQAAAARRRRRRHDQGMASAVCLYEE